MQENNRILISIQLCDTSEIKFVTVAKHMFQKYGKFEKTKKSRYINQSLI